MTIGSRGNLNTGLQKGGTNGRRKKFSPSSWPRLKDAKHVSEVFDRGSVLPIVEHTVTRISIAIATLRCTIILA